MVNVSTGGHNDVNQFSWKPLLYSLSTPGEVIFSYNFSYTGRRMMHACFLCIGTIRLTLISHVSDCYLNFCFHSTVDRHIMWECLQGNYSV